MNRTSHIPHKPDPWRVPVAVEQIPDTGVHRDIAADQAALMAMAEVAGVREIRPRARRLM